MSTEIKYVGGSMDVALDQVGSSRVSCVLEEDSTILREKQGLMAER